MSSVCQLSSCFFHFFRFLAMLRTSLVNQLITSQCFRMFQGTHRKTHGENPVFFPCFSPYFSTTHGGRREGHCIRSSREWPQRALPDAHALHGGCHPKGGGCHGISEVKVKKWGDLWRYQLITHSKKTINSWDIIWDIFGY